MSYFFKSHPVGNVFQEALLYGYFPMQYICVYIFGVPHHRKHIVIIGWRMRILICIGVGMVHPVHDGVCPGAHKGRSLGDIGKKVKKTLPSRAHGKSAVSGVTMLEECLGK